MSCLRVHVKPGHEVILSNSGTVVGNGSEDVRYNDRVVERQCYACDCYVIYVAYAVAIQLFIMLL